MALLWKHSGCSLIIAATNVISGTWGQALHVPILFHQRACQVGILPFVWEWSLLCLELMARIGCSFCYFTVFFSFSVQLLPFLFQGLFFSSFCLSVSPHFYQFVATSLSVSPRLWVAPLPGFLCASLFPCLFHSLSSHSSLYLSHHFFVLVCLAGPVLVV